MKKILIGILTAISFVNANQIHWSYGGENGPDRWAELSPDFYWCKLKNQSPVDISRSSSIDSVNPKLTIYYGKVDRFTVLNNGHTIQVNVEGDYHVEFNNKTYKLV